MKNEKAYCELCDDDVNYTTKEVILKTTINGVTFSYPYIESYCTHCGEKVFPVSISNKNDILKYDEYKKRIGLLTSVEIKEIRKKLNLTQEGLAKLMGCGLRTITRYENGGVQDRAFDNHIRLLEENFDLKQALKTKKYNLKHI